MEAFQALIEQAVEIAEAVARDTQEEWLAIDARAAAGKLKGIGETAAAGELQASGGAGLGIARALSEWAPVELYDAGKAVEDFYKERWR